MMMTYCFLCLKKYNQKTKETFSLFNWTTRDLWRYEYMAGAYYKPCKEFDICNELIEKYWETKQYDKCFEGHLVLAEQGYPLAECQIGYFYYVPQSMVIEMDNTIWQSFMKMQSEWKEISNRLSIGIDLLHCKTMIWQSRNAKNLELHCNYASQYNQQFVNFQFVALIKSL